MWDGWNHACANNYRAYENAKKLKTTDVDSNQLTSASGSEPSSNNMMMTPARQGNDEGANWYWMHTTKKARNWWLINFY